MMIDKKKRRSLAIILQGEGLMRYCRMPIRDGGFRESNSGPLAPEASIMPLNQIPFMYNLAKIKYKSSEFTIKVKKSGHQKKHFKHFIQKNILFSSCL